MPERTTTTDPTPSGGTNPHGPADPTPGYGFGGSDGPVPMPGTAPPPRRLRRSRDRKLAGVCGGLASYAEVDPVLVRLLFVAGLFAGGFTLPLYVAGWLLMPEPAPLQPRPAPSVPRAVA